jgi:FdhD protein
MTKGIQPARYLSLGVGEPLEIAGDVVEEAHACLSVNDLEIATFMCTPKDLKEFGVGILYNEGLIESPDEIESIHISKSNCMEIWLSKKFTPPKRMIVTAGCGGGVSFDDLSQAHSPLKSDLTASPDQLEALMKSLHHGASLYQQSRGIHTAVLAEGDQIVLQVEDIGRHNCLDKLVGAALLQSIRTEDCILLSSGRISSEMINKARRIGTPIVCSRTSPTSLSVALAESWDMTIVGYLRQNRMRIYSHPERILSLSAKPVSGSAGKEGIIG